MSSTTSLRLENRHTGEVLELRRLRRNGGPVLELRGTLPPHRQGPPLHIHHTEDEEGLVTSGTLSALVGGTRVDAGPGEAVRLPRGVPHRWWNGGDQPLAFKGWARPVVDLDRYLQAVFEVMNAGAPPVLQGVVFRLVVALGTVLGRYRGTAWPGCPARCTGAPEHAGKDA